MPLTFGLAHTPLRETISMPTPPIEIRPFEPSDATAFRELNEAWIEKHFGMEPHDHELLSEPAAFILRPGGRIFMACTEGRAIGCCALIPVRPGVYEVAKMAVAEQYRGRGVGRRLLAHVIQQARGMGARLLTLETNDRLANAVHLYEALGFRHVPPEPSQFTRANVFMGLPLV